MNKALKAIVFGVAICCIGTVGARTTKKCKEFSLDLGHGVGYSSYGEELDPIIPAVANPAPEGLLGSNVIFSGSFIYWRMAQKSTNFANRWLGTPTNSERQYSFKQAYEPGFMVSAMADLGDGRMGIIDYTRIHSTTEFTLAHPNAAEAISDTIPGTTHIYFNPGWVFPSLVNALSTSSTFTSMGGANTNEARDIVANWRCNYDVIDWKLGRWYYMGKNLSIFPTAGLRLALIDQRTRLTIRTFANMAATDPYINTMMSDSWLLGPTVALNMYWMFDYGFRIVGNIKGSLLYQNAKVQGTYSAVTGVVEASAQPYIPPEAAFSPYRRIEQTIPQVESMIGIAWSSFLAEDAWGLDLLVAYDYKYWFNQGVIQRTISQSRRLNLNRTFYLAPARTAGATDNDANYGVSNVQTGSNMADDLTIHGLTITLSLYF